MKKFRLILSAALAFLIVFSCIIIPARAFDPGDVDGSGKVNSSDARLALRASARIETLTSEQFAAADVDGSGKVNSSDARRILRAAARIEALPSAGPVAPHDAWVLIDTRVEEHRQPDTATDFFNYDASPGQHFCSMAHEFPDGSSVTAAYRGTCTPMPAEIGAGERVTAELRLWITEASGDDKGGHYTVEASLSRDVPGLKYDTYTEDRVPFTAAQSGGADRCIVDSPDINNKNPNDTEYARVSCMFPAGSPGEQWCVYFIACGCETVWTYEWQRVGKEEPSSTEPSTEPTTDPGSTTVIRRPLTEEEIEPLRSDDYNILFVDSFTVGDGDHTILDHYETVEFDIPDSIPVNERENYMGMYFADDGVHWMILDPDGLVEGKFRFETLHYCLLGIGEPATENQKMDNWAARAAALGVTRRISEEEVTPGVRDFVDGAMKAAGLGSDQYGGAIVRYILANDAKGELLTAAADGDYDSVKKIVVSGTAEYLCGKVLSGEDDGVLYGGGVDNAELLKKRVKEGDPSATLEIVKNIEKNMLPAVSYAEKFGGLVDKLADIWTDNMIEDQYALFEKYMKQDGKVSSEQWGIICTQLRGALNRLNSRGVSDEDLRRKFEQRYDNAGKIKEKHKEIMRLIARWNADHLLDYTYWKGSNGYPTTVEKLNSLLSMREMLREMLTKNGKFMRGADFTSDEIFLNAALCQWVINGRENRAAFYDWLRKQGVLPKLPEPTEPYTGDDPFNPELTLTDPENGDPGSGVDTTGGSDVGLETMDPKPGEGFNY